MPFDIARNITSETGETGRAAVERSRRAAAVLMTGFIVLLAIAGYRIKIRSFEETADEDDIPADYSDICPAPSSDGIDAGTFCTDVCGFPPVFFPRRDPA